MKKSTYLGLALLFCAANGHAQVGIKSFTELTAVKDSLAKVKVYEENLADAKTSAGFLQTTYGKEEPLKKEESKFTAGLDEKDAFLAFYNDYKKSVSERTGFDLKIKRVTAADEITELYIYSPTQDIADAITINSKNINSSSTLFGDSKDIWGVTFYIKEANGTYSPKYLDVELASTAKDSRVIRSLYSFVSNWALSETTVTSMVKNNAYVTGKELMAANENLQSYLNAALNGGTWTIKSVAWNDEKNDVDVTTVTSEKEHPGCRNYTDLQLKDNITIIDAEFSMDIAAGYTFDGAGNAITGMDGRTKALFGTNNGTISNVVLYGGCTLVGDNEGKISNVTVGAGQNGTVATTTVAGGVKNSIANPSGTLYNVYASDGTTASVDGSKVATYPNIYNNATLRNEFSVNVVNGIVSKDSDYKLYEVKAYSANLKEGQKRIVNINANGAITTNVNDSWSKDLNGAFYYVTDADAAEFLAKVEVSNAQPNVVYTTNGTDWYCKNATVYNEGTPIYIHEAFEAEKVNYNRTFTVDAEGASTICLPFAVSESELGSILGTNGKLLQFNKVEENGDNRTYWFKYVSGGMEANQPYILKFGEAVNGQIFNLENVKFNATGSANLASLEQSMEGVGASLCGTFKKQTASELEAGRYSIYGFKNGEFVRMTDGVVFNPTRAYVRREGFIPSTSSSAKSYKLGILDENDNEVTAINTVEKAAGAFSVKGGNGVITVNSDKAQNVKVYTAGGALVKNVAVSAGEVSIPVAAGLYIVNGSKVVVK